jgi:hypothetical protein
VSTDVTRARLAWRGSLVAAILNLLGSPLELVIARDVPGMPRWPSLASAAVAVVLLAYLVLRRARPTRAGAAITMLLNTAVIVTMLCINNQHWAALGPHWAPFQANKLGALTIGLLTPEIPVGLACIGAYALSAVVQFALLPPSVREQLARGEPMTTCVFAAFGVIILVVGTRRYALERRLLEQEHQAAALETQARALLAVRDFANTPLQTIEAAAALARAQHPEAADQLARIERAIERLRGLNSILSHHEVHLRWQPGDESFDALEKLARPTDGKKS